jgi:hypothetical protein
MRRIMHQCCHMPRVYMQLHWRQNSNRFDTSLLLPHPCNPRRMSHYKFPALWCLCSHLHLRMGPEENCSGTEVERKLVRLHSVHQKVGMLAKKTDRRNLPHILQNIFYRVAPAHKYLQMKHLTLGARRIVLHIGNRCWKNWRRLNMSLSHQRQLQLRNLPGMSGYMIHRCLANAIFRVDCRTSGKVARA